MSRFKNGMNDEKLKINLEMAKLSNFLVQSHGYKTCFYGDKKSLESFEDIKFNEHHELNDDRFNEIPDQMWSIGKLFSLLRINEPFIHMDYDIFLFKNFDQDFLNKEVVFYHNEFHLDPLVEEYQNYFELRPSNTKSFINRSYNCALFGGKNFKLIQDICEEIINFIIENKQSINQKLNSKESLNFMPFMPALLLEQVWIFQLLKHYKQEFSSYLHQTRNLAVISKEAYIKNICHLQGSKSNKLVLKNIFSMNKYLGI
jgi:hypothetical protein